MAQDSSTPSQPPSRGSYDRLRGDCPATEDAELAGTCDCQENEDQKHRPWLATLKRYLPTSWETWPTIRRGLILAGVAAVIAWLVVYIVLHFWLVQ